EAHDSFHNVDAQPHHASPLKNCAGDRLLNPPGCVSGETEALAVVKLGNGPDESNVALPHQIFKGEPLPNVFFSNAYDQAQVCLDQLVTGFPISLLGTFGKIGLHAGGEQSNARDLAQVEAQAITLCQGI